VAAGLKAFWLKAPKFKSISFHGSKVFWVKAQRVKKRLRQSGLVPAMSTFATPFWHAGTRVLRFLLAKRVEENHRCDVFFSEKGRRRCIGAVPMDGAFAAPF